MKVRLIVKAVAGLPAMAWRKRQLNRDVQAMVLGPGHKEYKLDWARIKARHLRSRESLSRFLREYAKEIVRIEREQKWLHGHFRPVPLARVRWIEQEIGLPITTVELSIKAERKRREIREFEKKEARKAKSLQRARLEAIGEQAKEELRQMEEELSRLIGVIIQQ